MRTLLNKESLVFEPPELGCVLSLSGFPGGGSKIYDRSPYGNIGTITGATWVKLPSGLWCLSFDGSDDKVDCGTSKTLTSLAGSIEFWVKLFDVGVSRDIIRLIQDASNALYVRKITTNKLDVFVVVAGAYPVDRLTTETLDTNWHHIVITQNGSTLLIYIDTVESAYGTDAGDWTSHLTLVNSYIGTTSFKGNIALPRIYGRPLSALEIQNHFNREKSLFGVW